MSRRKKSEDKPTVPVTEEVPNEVEDVTSLNRIQEESDAVDSELDPDVGVPVEGEVLVPLVAPESTEAVEPVGSEEVTPSFGHDPDGNVEVLVGTQLVRTSVPSSLLRGSNCLAHVQNELAGRGVLVETDSIKILTP